MMPTGGKNFVEMKKKRVSRQPSIIRKASAYAHGMPSSSTRIVDPTTTSSERPKNGPKPRSRIVWYCSNVGAKVNGGISVGARSRPGSGRNVGGNSTAAASVFKLVATRYRTGKKNNSATTHAV